MKRNIAFATIFAASLAVGVAAQAPAQQQNPANDRPVTVTGCIQPGGGLNSGTVGTTGGSFVLSNPAITSTNSTPGSSAANPMTTPPPTTTPPTPPTTTPPPTTPPTTTPPTTTPPTTTPPTMPPPTTPPTTTPPDTPPTTPPATTPNAPVGTSGGAAAGTNAFALTGGEQQNLQQYVNQRVEIQGTFETPASATSAPTPSAEPGMPANANQPTRTLHITSVRTLAGSCGGGE